MSAETRTILIVDDDPAIRKVLSLGLAKLGYSVLMAKNGAEALEMFSKEDFNPDCAMLDIRMPVLSGLEALPRIREIRPLTPVIMLTAFNDLQTGLESMRNGAFDYLVKPTRLEQIAETLSRAIHYRDIVAEKARQGREKEEYRAKLEKKVENSANELNDIYEKLKKANFQTVQALAVTIEAKDPYTQGHCERVRRISVWIAEAMKLPEAEIQPLEYAALLHDIGKIGIPERILNKEGPLNEEEMGAIKMHPIIGAQILSMVEFFAPSIAAVRHHHERWDGRGYPDGVACNDIDHLAQIITLADTFDAMATSRPYKDGLPLEKVVAEIEKERGSQFAPAVVDAFFRANIVDKYIETFRSGT